MSTLLVSLYLLQVGGGDFLVKEFTSIEYPRLALQAQIAGDVRLRVRVDRDGSIAGVKPISGHPVLSASAQEQIRTWKFIPCGGQAGDENGEFDLQFTFKLSSPPSHAPKSVTTYLHPYQVIVSSSELIPYYYRATPNKRLQAQ